MNWFNRTDVTADLDKLKKLWEQDKGSSVSDLALEQAKEVLLCVYHIKPNLAPPLIFLDSDGDIHVEWNWSDDLKHYEAGRAITIARNGILHWGAR